MKIRINDIEINYEMSGKKGAPTVVLSHSLAASMGMWDPQIELLRASFNVLRYDMRGHGQSEASQGEYSLDLLASDVIGLMDALKLDQVHFVGLSIGGMIGQCLALNYAERLISLTLCDTAAVMPKEGHALFEERMEKVRQHGMAALGQETLTRWFTAPYLEKKPAIVDRIFNQILDTTAAGFIGCGRAILNFDYSGQLAKIKLPTLIIVGADDPGTPVAAAEAIHKQIAGSKLIILPSAAHLSNIEQADGFNKALMAFLKAR
jgi:3-oxoadipate enol-lactonase